ncbi:MAG: toluene hydroxylase, partial [Actinomycetia bacterium]|nr:toluene hydroxylase [Actinomycetes bacterium]
DYNRDLDYTRALFRMLARDEQHATENKEVFQGWLSTWVPKSLEAAHALQPIWSQPAERVLTFAESLGAAKEKFAQLLEDIGLDVPKELDK